MDGARSNVRRRLATLVGLALAASVLLAQSSSLATAKAQEIIEFDMMVGVPQAFTGATNPIRGINGGGIPWTLSSGKGEVRDGHLSVKVTGLVLAAGANAGRNPSATFRAIVSCLNSAAAIVNVATDAFPATVGLATEGGGDSDIEADVALPQPCIAPIVFVTSAGLSWFATTGG
jgi:hypothetical protein